MLNAVDSIELKVGDIYWDCGYHPVRCTEVDGDDVCGVSLFDGSSPRSCSIYHCGITILNEKEVEFLMSIKDEILAAETQFRNSGTFDTSGYDKPLEKISQSGLFYYE